MHCRLYYSVQATHQHYHTHCTAVKRVLQAHCVQCAVCRHTTLLSTLHFTTVHYTLLCFKHCYCITVLYTLHCPEHITTVHRPSIVTPVSLSLMMSDTGHCQHPPAITLYCTPWNCTVLYWCIM